MHCILPVLALSVVTLSWTISPNHLAQLTYIVSNHCYEQNPFLDPVFYSRCHLPFTPLTGKKKGNPTLPYLPHFLVHFNQTSTPTALLKLLLWTLKMASKCQILCPLLSLDPVCCLFQEPCLSICWYFSIPSDHCSSAQVAGSTFISASDSGIPMLSFLFWLSSPAMLYTPP